MSLPLEVCVRDNGPGIAPDIPANLFDPFVSTKGKGSGLGLALVAKLVGDHGGTIEFESHPRRTSFRVLMPLQSPRASAPKEVWTADRRRSSAMPSEQILVADDDAGIRTVFNQALTRAGYEVRATGTVAGLWRWVAAGEGDLVITDVVMPDDNAFDLMPRIKRMRPDLPIIVMSAQNTFMTAIKASESGAYEYLPKPFDLSELVAVVGRALAEPKRRRDERGRRAGRGHAARRPFAGDAGHLPGARAADADRPDRHDFRRVRHRQGARRARAARLGKRRAGRSSPSTWPPSRAT